MSFSAIEWKKNKSGQTINFLVDTVEVKDH